MNHHASFIPANTSNLRRWASALIGASAIALLAACSDGIVQSTDPAAPLEISAKIDASISSPITGQEVRLSPDVSFKGTIPAGATLTQVSWNFGDGSPAVTISNAANFTTAQFKSYAAAGNYTVTLSATAATGERGSVTRVISVQGFALTGVLANSNADNDPPNIGNYTRLGADGQPLAIQNGDWQDNGTNAAGTRWDCIKDNQSGLIWEVKTKNDPTALRHFTSTFTWFEDSSGTESGGVCNGVEDTSKCNTKSYTTSVKALPAGQALCGFRDWRMPSIDELRSIALTTASNPAIQATDFPDVNLANLLGAAWSGSSNSGNPAGASSVFFDVGSDNYVIKHSDLSVRLVRSGQ